MSYGLKIYNDWGSLQIDDTYFNLSYRQKFNVEVGVDINPPLGEFIPAADFSITTSYTPIIAISTPSAQQRVYVVGGSSVDIGGGQTQYTYNILAISDPGYELYFTFEVFVFGPPVSSSEVSIPTYGMVVYNQSGQITFRSDLIYFNVAGVVSKALPTNGQSSFTDSYLTPGRKYAVVPQISTMGKYFNSTFNSYDIFLSSFGTTNSGTPLVKCGWDWSERRSSQIPSANISSTQFIILDVTGT